MDNVLTNGGVLHNSNLAEENPDTVGQDRGHAEEDPGPSITEQRITRPLRTLTEKGVISPEEG